MSEHEVIPSFPQDPAQITRRLERARRSGCVLLADCSGSMANLDRGLERRIERLAKVLAQVLAKTRLEALVAFHDYPQDLALTGHVRLPEPFGGTNLWSALDYALDLRPPFTKLVVLSDGWPNDPEAALNSARRAFPRPIGAYFIGSDEDQSALEFMRRLAHCGGPGSHWDRYDLAQTDQVAHELLLRITDQRSS